MGKLFSHTVKISKLKDYEVDRMYELFMTYYDNTRKEKFLKDLLNKDKVILLRDKKEKNIQGFSTIKFIEKHIQSKKVFGLFSGDTIIHVDFWGQTALTMEFFKNLMLFKLAHPFSPFYWFLISKGFKTYLLLTNNFCNYYPRFDKPTPLYHNEIIDSFANEVLGDSYDQEHGILRCANQFDRLRGEVAPIDDKALKNPNIKFFQDKNTKWMQGDELCCIGGVDLGLITKYLLRTYRKRLKPFLFFFHQKSGS